MLLPAGERGDLAVAQLLYSYGGERALDAALYLVMGHAEVLQAKEHLVLYHGGDHLRVDVLRHGAHHAGDVREADLAGVAPLHAGGAVERAPVMVGDGAGEHGGQRGLAGARGAYDADELALLDAKRDVGKRPGGLLAVGEADVF